MTWSFTRLSAYAECPRQFYLKYIKKSAQDENAFAQWGKFCHDLFNRYLTGKLELYELADAYREEYASCVTAPFPESEYINLAESYFEKGISVFSNYTGVPNSLTCLSSEKRVTVNICGVPLVGYIDAVFLRNRDGARIVHDYKSKSKFKSKKEQAESARQLYIYAQAVQDEYGDPPKLLRFDLFRSGQYVDIPFQGKDKQETDRWVLKTYESACADTTFQRKPPSPNDFFCTHLCSVRTACAEADIFGYT